MAVTDFCDENGARDWRAYIRSKVLFFFFFFFLVTVAALVVVAGMRRSARPSVMSEANPAVAVAMEKRGVAME